MEELIALFTKFDWKPSSSDDDDDDSDDKDDLAFDKAISASRGARKLFKKSKSIIIEF